MPRGAPSALSVSSKSALIRGGSPLLVLSVALLAAPGPSTARAAVIYAPPDLGELARRSEAVVLARALQSTPRGRNLIFTDTVFAAEVVLKGDLRPGHTFRTTVPGGAAGDLLWFVPGSPRFEAGRTYLLFLRAGADGRHRPLLLSYGLLREEKDPAEPLLVPIRESRSILTLDASGAPAHTAVRAFRRDALLELLAAVLAGRRAWDARSAAAEVEAGGGAAAPPGCTFFEDAGRRFRWRTFDSGGEATIYADATGDFSRPDGGFRDVAEAIKLWHSISGSGANLRFGGVRSVSIDCSDGRASEAGVIVFNDPCNEMEGLNGCGGILGFGGPIASGTHTFDGATWLTIRNWIVVLNDGAGCIGTRNYRILIAHELGHGLGFGHFDDSGSLMFASCCQGPNSTDAACLRYTYPQITNPNSRPLPDAGPDRDVLLAGETIRLEGSAGDDGVPGPLETRWRQLAGPAAARFSDPAALVTEVSFPVSGNYLLALDADDGELFASDTVEIAARVHAGSESTFTFQQGLDGYAGTEAAVLREADPGRSFPNPAEIEADADDPSGTGLEVQTLLAFRDLFGNPGGIPPGAEILRAALEFRTTNRGDGARLYRLQVPWDASAAWNDFAPRGIEPGEEAAPQPDALVSGLSEVPIADVTAGLRAWSADPCSARGWALLPAGDDGWNASGPQGAFPPRLEVTARTRPPLLLIPPGAEWRYLEGRSAPPPDWNRLEFAPGAAWKSGRTGIGYGDGDDATVLSDMQGSYLTVYCRKEFELEGALGGALLLTIDYDDGFVAYLNGIEAARSASLGPPGSPVSHTTPASSHEAGSPEVFSLDTSLLRPGRNVLAVAVHNQSLTSSDLSFIPTLTLEPVVFGGNAEWRFHRGAPPSGWTSPEFDDSSWESGRTGIGYGDGDDLTVLDDMQDSYLAIACRRSFDLAAVPAGGLELAAVYDDGFVAYANGTEVGRRGMPSGPVDFSTPARSAIEPEAAVVPIPAALLSPGRNVLAVSVHNASLGSSDLSFDAALYLAGTSSPPPPCGAPAFLRGDATDDGSIDVSDAVRILLYLFRGGFVPACPDAFDTDDDGSLSVTDAVALLGHLFRGGPPPPPPYGDCGPDPTADELEPCEAQGCGE